MTVETINGPCAVCARAGRGVRVLLPPAFNADALEFCSLQCARLYMAARTEDLIVTPDERAAMEAGGKAGGQYLENIGKTDLRDLSKGEWARFLEFVVRGYTDDLRRQAAESVPF